MTILSTAQRTAFDDDGYVVVRGAFASEDASAMQDEWWAELAEMHGILRDDRSTWRPVLGDLKRPKLSALEGRILTPRVQGAIDDLLGAGAWKPPGDWGRALVTFPQSGPWDVPTGLWHWDTVAEWHHDALKALFVVSFVGAVAPRSGGTLILAGSPRLLRRHAAELTPAQRLADHATRRELFSRSRPWLKALTGKAPSPPDRIAAFMTEGAEIDGIPLRVVELTGEPGDMVLCHPAIVHSVAPNCGSQPRFMRIRQQILSEVGPRSLARARQG